MTFSLIWLPQVLKDSGLRVALHDGWDTRGFNGLDVGNTVGVICHHTATPDPQRRRPVLPTLSTLINGRSDLPGPLAQLGLARDGTYHVIAAGWCNHAGPGQWQGVTTGNRSFIGIEAENTGGPDDTPWPEVQMDAYRRGVAAILAHIGKGPEFCAGHKEWAPKRKTDPDFDMVAFRAGVAAILNGTAPAPTLIPAVEPSTGRSTLRRPTIGELVKQAQAKLGVPADGNFGPKTEAAVRAFQRDHGLVPDGIVGPQTWAALDAA